MADIKKDDNLVPTLSGVLNTDGVTITRIKADPTTHIIQTDDNTTGTDFGKDEAVRDSNGEPIAIATDASGNIIPLYVDSNGKLLIQSS